MSSPSTVPASPLPRTQRRRLTIRNLNVGIPAVQCIPSAERPSPCWCGEIVAPDNVLCHELNTEFPACAIPSIGSMSQMSLDRHNGTPASVESTSDIGYSSTNTDSNSRVINREVAFKWAASDVSRHCSLRMLHTLARCCGFSDNKRWLCCSLELLERGVSLATPLPQDRSSTTSLVAMSLDGKKPNGRVGCKFDTGAMVSIIRESRARDLGWTPAASFDPDQHDLVALSRELEIVPIGFLKMPVRPEGRRRQCVVDFLVVTDKASDQYDVLMSEKYIERLHLHHRTTFCLTGVCITLLSILRPASIHPEG